MISLSYINNNASSVILQPPCPKCFLIGYQPRCSDKKNQSVTLNNGEMNSYTRLKMLKKRFMMVQQISELKNDRVMLITLTTCLAASSAGNPRQEFAAISEVRASQIPSEAIISLPPAFKS